MWPAINTAVSSPWPAISLQQIARSHGAAAKERSVKSRLPDPPARRPTGPTQSENPHAGSILGCATKFGIWCSPVSEDFPDCRLMFRHGCFDRTLANVREGRREIKLHMFHDPIATFATTKDKSLRVWVEANELRFRVLPNSRNSRSAIRTIKASDCRLCSVGCVIRKAETYDEHSDPPIISVVRADLIEISILEHAAVSSTWIRFL